MAAAGAAAAVAFLVIRGRREDTLGPEGVVDTAARRRRGSIEDRGQGASYAIDVERLRSERDDLEPTVEYLTYIQSHRGDDGEHILFVRNEDIDAIAALEGEQPDEFVERLQQLGVVISIN